MNTARKELAAERNEFKITKWMKMKEVEDRRTMAEERRARVEEQRAAIEERRVAAEERRAAAESKGLLLRRGGWLQRKQPRLLNMNKESCLWIHQIWMRREEPTLT